MWIGYDFCVDVFGDVEEYAVVMWPQWRPNLKLLSVAPLDSDHSLQYPVPDLFILHLVELSRDVS